MHIAHVTTTSWQGGDTNEIYAQFGANPRQRKKKSLGAGSIIPICKQPPVVRREIYPYARTYSVLYFHISVDTVGRI